MTLEVLMQSYVRNENITRYRKLIAVIEGDPARDERRYQTLLRLLADEEAERKKLGKLDS